MSILNNTKFSIKVGSEYIDITNDIKGSFKMDERIDMVLDSGSLFINTDEFTQNIPPFSILLLEKKKLAGNHFVPVKQYFYCSSNCFDNLVGSKRYYHEIQVIEPTKMLEKFIVGAKSFSNVKGAYSYNTTYDQMQILVKLMKSKYGVNLNIDSSLNFMKEEREYSFGAGTTLKDCLNEMMLPYKCIPRAVLEDTTLTITCDNLNDFDNQLTTNIEQWSFKEESQSVDDYCSQLEASYSTVVDRDTTNQVNLSIKSLDDIFSKDNGCLVLPCNVEDIISLGVYMNPCYTSYTLQYTTTYSGDANKFAILGTRIETDFYSLIGDLYLNGYISLNKINCIKSFISSHYDKYGSTDQERQVYIRSELVDKTVYSTIYSLNECVGQQLKDLTKFVLPIEKWNLLDAADQPSYLYFENGSNYIKGFYNTFHDSFWEKGIYGAAQPFLEGVIYNGAIETDDNLINEANLKYTNSGTTIPYFQSSSYHVANISVDYTKYVYHIEYKAQSPLYAVADKTISSTNETAYRQTSRTYNNGASVVDFNQLTDALQKSVDLLGLPITTIKSNEDYSIGTLTQFGYVISKQSEYCPFYNEFTYNCCDNVKQIAQAIGVKTQYEATNLPQRNTVDRFIYTDLKVSQGVYNTLSKGEFIYLIIQMDRAENEDEAPVIAKPMSLLTSNNVMHLICQAQDNYSFDTRKVAGYNSYFKNEPVMYANANNYINAYANVYIGVLKEQKINTEMLNNMPNSTKDKFDILVNVFNSNRVICKDPRERLIFDVNISLED